MIITDVPQFKVNKNEPVDIRRKKEIEKLHSSICSELYKKFEQKDFIWWYEGAYVHKSLYENDEANFKILRKIKKYVFSYPHKILIFRISKIGNDNSYELRLWDYFREEKELEAHSITEEEKTKLSELTLYRFFIEYEGKILTLITTKVFPNKWRVKNQ